jgi:hypothetical protein
MTAAAMIIKRVPMATDDSRKPPLGRADIGSLALAALFTLSFCDLCVRDHLRPAEVSAYGRRI